MTRARFTLWRGVVALVIVVGAFVAAPRFAVAQLTPADSALVAQPSLAPKPGVDSVLDAKVHDVATRLRCPVCQGESIQDSPAELAAQMKTLVREQLAAGKSEREVMDYFLAKYGQWIMLEPRAEGFNLFVYALPIVFILAGAAAIWVMVKRWTRPMVVAPVVVAPMSTTPMSVTPEHTVSET